MSEKSNVPEIRFEGFNDDISSKKLKEVVLENIYGPRFNANDYDVNGNVKTIRGTDISSEGNILYHQVPIANLDTSFIENHILEDGDLVMITTADCGLTGIFEEQDDKYICSAYAVKITLNKSLTFPTYFKYFFQTTLAQNEVDKLTRKATVANLASSDILKVTHTLPSKEEQEKIAFFFTSLYKLIEQKEKKQQQLKQLKKAMLSKMFPKEGADVPEIRFEGFSGGWEEKKLGDVTEIVMGQSPSSTSYNSNKNGIPLIQGNADIENRLSSPRNWTTEITKECKVGDLILTVRAPVGAVSKSVHNACIGRGVCAIRSKGQSSNEFIYQFLLDYETKWSTLEQGSTFTAVSGEEIKKITINIPLPEEQTKIGNYFQKLDKLIDLQQKELEKLKNIKKASLDKMFV